MEGRPKTERQERGETLGAANLGDEEKREKKAKGTPAEL